MRGSYLGPQFDEKAIEKSLNKLGAKYTKYSSENLVEKIANQLKDESKVEVPELKNAISSLLENKPAPEDQVPSMGCSIKWK